MNVVVKSVVAAGISVAGATGAVLYAPTVLAAPAPAEELLTAAQVTGILGALTDPSVPDRARKRLVQGGINDDERQAFQRGRLERAVSHGELPLSFQTGNIWWVGPSTAAAEVTLAGKKLPPVSKVVTFVDQNGWMLSSDSAATLIQTVTKS